MNITKRTTFATLALAALAVGMPTAASAAETAGPDELSDQQIVERIDQISGEYDEVGDVLSAEDAEFIKEYAPVAGEEAQNESEISPMATASYNVKGSGSGVGSGYIYGNLSLSTAGLGPTQWSGSLTSVATAGNISSIKNCFQVGGYGLIGSDGVGVIHASNPCANKSGAYHSRSDKGSFGGLTAYSTIMAKVTFAGPSGSFSILSTDYRVQ